MAARVEIGVASEERIGPFLRLTGTHYQDKPVNSAEVVRWRHLESPEGPAVTVELVDGGEPVGRMWIGRHRWAIRGRRVTAANPIDFLIREDHRSLPAFMALFRATMAESHRQAELVYHTSNPLTDDLYRKLMKMKPVTELDGALVPIRPLAAAQAAGLARTGAAGRALDALFVGLLRLLAWSSRPGGVGRGPPPPAEEQERLVGEFTAAEPVCAVRSAGHRAWRYRGAGPVQYRVEWLTRRGAAFGYLVTSDREIDGLKGCFVVDAVFSRRPSRWETWSLWLRVAAQASSRGMHALFLFHNRRNGSLARLASLPMVTVPRSRLPQQVPVFVRLAGSADPAILDGVDLGAGYYLLADFDMF
jgi:hypothetical protein